MSKTFRNNPDTLEKTTREKRYGNTRKFKAIEAVKERRKRRKELGVEYDKLFNDPHEFME